MIITLILLLMMTIYNVYQWKSLGYWAKRCVKTRSYSVHFPRLIFGNLWQLPPNVRRSLRKYRYSPIWEFPSGSIPLLAPATLSSHTHSIIPVPLQIKAFHCRPYFTYSCTSRRTASCTNHVLAGYYYFYRLTGFIRSRTRSRSRVGYGGALVVTTPFDRMVVGSNPALAAM